MTLSDVKDQIIDRAKSLWSNIQETSLYIQGKEKYDDLSPTMQRLTQALAAFFVFLLLIMMPWAWMETSDENIQSFETRKGMIRSLLQLKRDVQQAPQVPPGMGSAQLKSEAQKATSTMGLTAEQIKGIEEVTINAGNSTLIPPIVEQSGIQVQVWKINLTQFVDLSYKLQRLNSSAKLMSVDMKANSDDPHYYDVIYQLVSFSAPQAMASNEPDEKDDKKTKEDN